MTSFIISMPILIMRAYLVQSTFKTEEAAMSWIVIIAILGPAQGFLNALVFFKRIDGFKKLCQRCTFPKLCRRCTFQKLCRCYKKDSSAPIVSGNASDKEKHIAAPRVSSMTVGTQESGKTVSNKATESGEESKIDEETTQAAEVEMDELTPKTVEFDKELKILKHSETDSEENNWAAAEEFLALTEDDGTGMDKLS